ncbi:hypothetical protein MRX96_031779 [Rhipicephalus microplus]
MQFLISELLTTAAYLLRPEQTNGAFGDVVSPYAYDAATVDIPVSPMTRENTTAKVTTDGQAKALYESCRFHQECSHLNANMRCVDSLLLPCAVRAAKERTVPRATGDHDEPGNEVTSSIIPPSLPVYSPGDVKKASSLGLLSGEVLDTLPPPLSPAASQDTDAASYLTQRNCIRLGSLRNRDTMAFAECSADIVSSVLGIDAATAAAEVGPADIVVEFIPCGIGYPQQHRAKGGTCRDTPARQSVSTTCSDWGSPFMDADEDLLSDTASIALSFLSPESSSSREATQPRTDIHSAMLRAADAAEEDVTSKELEVEDALLVELFMATALEDASLSDGVPPPLPLNEAERVVHEEERVTRMVEERRVHTTLSRLRSFSPRWKVQPSSQTSLKHLSPTASQRTWFVYRANFLVRA